MTIAAFGDSITEGTAIKNNPSMKNWTEILQDELGVKVYNFGVGGNNTKQALERIENVLITKCNYTLVEFGMNDHIITNQDGLEQIELQTFKSNIEQICNLCISIGSIPILLTPNYVIEEYYYSRHEKNWYDLIGGANSQIKKYRDALMEIASKNNYFVIDMFKEFEKMKPSLHTLLRSKSNGNFADGVHLYGEGLKFYADIIIKYFKENIL